MALRIMVKLSAIKSVLDIFTPLYVSLYQLAFLIPGINPCHANSRKQMRQSWNLRKYPPERPQMLQRLCLRVENFGARFHRAI
jgi:hypothetical protein